MNIVGRGDVGNFRIRELVGVPGNTLCVTILFVKEYSTVTRGKCIISRKCILKYSEMLHIIVIN